MSLELSAMRWLWLEQNCLVVLEERTPQYMMGLPDVLGITPGRYMTEIEIKRSASDFRADFEKPHRKNRQFYIKQQPRQFYYLMPKDLGEKMQDKIPEWAGLMVSRYYPLIEVIKKAPVNKLSEKLSLKQCTRLARQMTAHMMSVAMVRYENCRRFSERDCQTHIDWVNPGYGTYEI